MKSRHWSIRSKIIALVAVPLVALLALWTFATVLTAGPALHLLSARTLVTRIGNPGQVLVAELQRERRLSVQYLSTTGQVPPQLTAQRAATDRAASDFRQSAGGPDVRGRASAGLRARMDQLFSELNTLPGQRVHIDLREVDAIGAQGIFNAMLDASFQMFASSDGFGDESVDREIGALTTVGQAQEYLARIDSLLAGATVAGKFTDPLRTEMMQDIGTGRFLLAQGVDDLSPASRTAFQALSRNQAYEQLNGMMDTLVEQARSGAVSPVAGDDWHDAYVESGRQLRDFELDAIDDLAQRTTPLAVRVLVRLGLAGALGLIALIVSIVVSIKVGRSIVGRLRRLRAEALEMAGERLPNVVRRLQRGEAVDVDVETPPLEYGKDEIGQLGHAFNDVQRTAVQSAVEEASVRQGLNEVFLNIARRSQTLLHRQLALLDRMERRETEPQELEDLYRVDHLATRMRRHAEDLVILAGAAPGRGWRNPVPVIDVVRGAISEVEDYKRVDIRQVASASVLGRAVGDVIHLLAELLENAASYSPPHTRVEVTGQVLPNGYAIEIEDRGLGMTQEAIDEANRKLVEPPDFDPADSARLGLFVVAQLANRHGIRVSLRASAYGGVTAIVFVPGDLVTPGPAALPSGSSPADRSWEQPLLGSGQDVPARSSLAALQWSGSEPIEQVPVTRRPVTINGTATPVVIPQQRSEPAIESAGGQHRAVAGGPAPSSVVAGLTPDGLVQRRRVRRPADLGASDLAASDLAAAAADLAAQNDRTAEIPKTVAEAGTDGPPNGRSTPRNSGPVMPTSSSPLFPNMPPTLTSSAPTSAGPMFAAPISPAPIPPPVSPASISPAPIPPSGSPSPGSSASGPALEQTEDGLPRRVRQASLAPQLRRAAGAEPVEEETVAFRSPEQVRSIMSALQRGTARGRIDASAAFEDPSNAEKTDVRGRSSGGSFAEAATVSFPAIVNLAVGPGEAGSTASEAPTEASSGGGKDAAGDRADVSGVSEATRPEKDAQ